MSCYSLGGPDASGGCCKHQHQDAQDYSENCRNNLTSKVVSPPRGVVWADFRHLPWYYAGLQAKER